MTITFQAIGTLTDGTTSAAVPYPAGIAAGDLLLLVATCKYSAFTSAPPSGFTLVHERVGGSGGTGADAGNTRTAAWKRVANGSESGTVSVTKATETGTVINARMLLYRSTVANGAWTVIGDSGTSSSGTPAWTAVAANNEFIRNGDVVVVVSGINTDLPTWASQAVAATGCTFSAVVERNDGTGTTTGHDLKLLITEHTCTAGPSSTVATYTATASTGSPDGASVIVRISEGWRMTAAQGTYALTGPDTGLLRGLRIALDTGYYIKSGQDVTFQTGVVALRSWFTTAWKSNAWSRFSWFAGSKSVVLDRGSYALTGSDAALKAGRRLTVDSGTYNLAGQDISYKLGKVMPAGTGNYALTGSAAGSVRHYRLTAETGNYALTGSIVQFHFGGSVGLAWYPGAWKADAWGGTVWADNTSVPGSYSMPARTGYYSLTQTTTINAWFAGAWADGAWDTGSWVGGSGATRLLVGRRLTADTGYYVYTGDDALRDVLLQTVPSIPDALYTLTGNDVNLNHGKSMTASVGSYILTGRSANLLKGYRMDAGFGSYLVTGSDAEFPGGVGALLDTGYYALTGEPVTFSVTRNLVAETGTYALAGQNAKLIKGEFLNATTGFYALSGQDASLHRSYHLDADTGYYKIFGQISSTPQPTAGRKEGGIAVGKRGKKRKYVVEIDGEEFIVESAEEAQALLDAAAELAAQKAKEEANAIVQRRLAIAKASGHALDVSAVELELPVVKSDNEALQDELNKIIAKAYERAEVEAEIAVRLAKRRLEDEEDNLVLLLLND